MSIIYEALKKTQNSSKSMPAGIIPNTSQKKGLKKAGKFPYAPVLGIIIGLGLVFFISVRPRLGKSQKIAESPIVRQPESKQSVSPMLSFSDKPENSLARSVRLSPLQSEKDQIPSLPPFSSQDVPGEAKKPQRRQPHFVVNGIVISPEGNIALINDQII
ncbi:MAG: hypothetical protein AABZ27_05445, partial [Candidatus Omnitrophota bacterium]